MKSLHKIIMTVFVGAALSMTAFGQKNDQKKPPPKGDPPVVTPQPKNPQPRETPRPPKRP